LLRAHSKSLRHLSISSSIFYDDEIEDGINLLTTIGHDLVLESLVLVDLSYENKHSLVSIVGEEIKGESSAQVTAIVDDLIKSVRTMNTKMERTGADDEEPDDNQAP
ncbi:hypothetical protein KCU63_g11472, partial [Aureobasidium melanogenum]